MASRVNVKFVISLASVVAVVAVGVAGAFVFVNHRSGERYIRMGDEAMARQDYTAADSHYARAVGKEPGNVEWIRQWREAREKKIPETYSAYQQDYSMYVLGILRTMATVPRTNIDAHVEYLDALYRERVMAPGRDPWNMLITETEFCLAFFEPEQPAQLRRYRGLAVAAILDGELQIDDDLLQRGREDLEAALAHDPTDALAARGLATWHRAAAENPHRRLRAEEREAHLEASRKVLADLLQAAPDHPLGLVDQLTLIGADVQLLSDPSRTAAEVHRMRIEALNSLRPRLVEVFQRLAATDPADLSTTVLTRFLSVAARIDTSEGIKFAEQLIDRALEHRPASGDLLALQASVRLLQQDIDGALDAYQRLADLPNIPISFEGVRLWEMRQRARFMQANIAATVAVQSTASAERTEAIERARRYREVLSDHLHERAPELLFIDGKLLFAEGDLSGAQRTLTEFVRGPGTAADHEPEALIMLADCAIRRDTPGLAREYLQQVQRLRPTAADVLMALGKLEAALQNPAQAERIFQRLLEQNPDNQAAKEQLELVRAMQGEAQVSDPVLQVVVQAERLSRGDGDRLGDDEAAIALLERSLAAHNHDPRLLSAIVQLKLMRDDKDGAIRTLSEAMARHPENTAFAEMRRRVEATGSLELTIAMIDESGAPELEKVLNRHRLYRGHGRAEEARASLEKAVSLAPRDPRVVELRFVEAIEQKDLKQAAAIADEAARHDVDRADGDTYRARLQLVQGNPQQAVITLQRAADRGNANAALLRLLGLTQMELGRTAEAITSLRRAVELAPHDVNVLKSLTRALFQNRMQQEALAVARGAEAHARRDPEFLSLWLSLEANAGNIQFARERREQIAAQNPDDRDNLAALAELYIAEKRFDRARRLIDSLADHRTTQVVALDARWHADRGDMEGARKVWVDHIGDLQKDGATIGPEPFLAFGQFFLQRNQIDLGLAAMREAARLQDPKTRSVDLTIADVLLALGRFGEAEKSFRAVLEAGVEDPRHGIRKRLIEALVQQSKFAEAEREFATLGDAVDSDVELLGLRSEVARGLGDTRAAREALDRAVARFPEEPLGYLRRARLIMNDPELSRDALADLSTVLRLRPGSWQALRMRATIHFASDQSREALRDLVAAVDANPALDELRVDTIRQLLKFDRDQEAVDLAQSGTRLRPADLRLLTMIADAFGREGRWRAAAPFYRQAWEINPGDEAATLRYVQALVSAAPDGQRSDPHLTQAQQVLATPALNTDRSMNLLMARASLRRKQGQGEAARGDALQALSLTGGEPRLLVGWHDRLRQVYTEPGEALAILNAAQFSEDRQEWHRFLQSIIMLSAPDRREEGLSMLRSSAAGARDSDLRLNALRILGGTLAEDGQWEEALAATRQALAMAPDDFMLNNNAAYFLEKLGRAEDALPFARKAMATQPENSAVLDTLSAVQWAANDRPAAIQSLARSARQSQTDTERIRRTIKLGRWKLETGDRTGAMLAAQDARELILMTTEDAAAHRPELDKLQSDIEQAR